MRNTSGSTTLQNIIIRFLDILAALLGGLVAAPVVLILCMVIQINSPGSGLFRQTRVGRGEREFTCLKLRTMQRGTKIVATHEAPAVAVTPLGGVLRRLKLDELPQLWNVLVGDMSLVGPRPCLPQQTELIEQRRIRRVYDVRPGITGPSQVKDIDMSTPTTLAIEDATYANAPSVSKYIRYVLMTVAGRGQGDRVNAA